MTKATHLPDYAVFIAALKDRVLHARTRAAHAVSRELVLLYWDIGRGIAEKQQAAGWGDAVVERLAADLRAEFPDMSGFSSANLWRMKQFYLPYSSPEFLAQAVREMKTGKFEIEIKCGHELIASGDEFRNCEMGIVKSLVCVSGFLALCREKRWWTRFLTGVSV